MLYGVIGVLGVFIAIIPFAVYRLIEMAGNHGHMAMACVAANRAAAGTGAVIAAIVIIFPFARNIRNMAVSALLAACGIAAVAVPRIFPLCGSADMACRYLTKPTLTVLGSAIITLSLALLAGHLVSRRREPDR